MNYGNLNTQKLYMNMFEKFQAFVLHNYILIPLIKYVQRQNLSSFKLCHFCRETVAHIVMKFYYEPGWNTPSPSSNICIT